MIKVESLEIQELRGIRDLTLEMNSSTFVICGPNGSGKSGVVDAIQFALTGEIGRLTGAGSGELKLKDHGPHVDKRDDPAAAVVSLRVLIPSLGTSARITRTIKNPGKPVIEPDEPDVRAVLDEIASHPELTLSRREIIKFILAEPTNRSREVQSLLKLNEIDQLRSALKTTETKLLAALSASKSQEEAAEQSLKRHLDLPELRDGDVLEVVNENREVLGLTAIEHIEATTSLSEGLQLQAKISTQGKDSALKDLDALLEVMNRGIEKGVEDEIRAASAALTKLEQEPTFFEIIRKRPFIETGLTFVDSPECPLCNREWSIAELREHLEKKLKASREAQEARELLESAGVAVGVAVRSLNAAIVPALRLPEVSRELVSEISTWYGELSSFADSVSTVEGVVGSKDRLLSRWARLNPGVAQRLGEVRNAVASRPDENIAGAARDFLVLAEERWTMLNRARRTTAESGVAAKRARLAYKTYCEVSEEALTTLYDSVESDFARYYRLLNSGDETKFKAKFEPAQGKLGLSVDFYERGMFPPAAYHSEGHQDGMGVCLYLALMKRVFGSDLCVAVLDDVVMSVDSQHRKQFCRLLKSEFPSTQFVITTHDQVWSHQMRSEGLVTAKTTVAFQGWSVDSGPVIDEVKEVWERIDEDLAKNEVPAAAARLRRHLEFVATDLANELGAKVHFRADGGYDKGELLSAVVRRQGELLGKAEKAAKSWKNEAEVKRVNDLQQERSEILTEVNGEDWVINKALHYNEWADLSREDFRPVVSVFRRLLQQFRCSRCDSWVHLSSRVNAEDLRCVCGEFRLNLRKK
ncbi:MAG: ATP-binding protein [Acidobacteria bacterium]|nr:ATP-binding protein [Acidobacteriota bacterium]